MFRDVTRCIDMTQTSRKLFVHHMIMMLINTMSVASTGFLAMTDEDVCMP